ncbi:hypothetical protein CONPUDRAFT_88636 [Coniophora puteana RWD-64-598 SS2]|uniref:Uncharacterized protein n=1 Tax=Coniophora puteana (strain RWD-64-598) TaxID=741705 RepID=A0A5M3N0G1_CONPW|nr:uncharacterized protein CONPUDRAFT_88636 [Coniophora puteana RWD-64-598 SS2]EIW84381.1 hypothetical protein CONPUDRAFT_88636 [Coniophora puteana RWD-64-598 SS2]
MDPGATPVAVGGTMLYNAQRGIVGIVIDVFTRCVVTRVPFNDDNDQVTTNRVLSSTPFPGSQASLLRSPSQPNLDFWIGTTNAKSTTSISLQC